MVSVAVPVGTMRAGVCLRQFRKEFARLPEGDVRRQRRHVRIGFHFQHDRAARRSAPSGPLMPFPG
jgi:hypothetical protein